MFGGVGEDAALVTSAPRLCLGGMDYFCVMRAASSSLESNLRVSSNEYG